MKPGSGGRVGRSGARRHGVKRKHGCHEARGQSKRQETGGQRSPEEVRGQKPEARGQRPEVSGQRPEARSKRQEARAGIQRKQGDRGSKEASCMSMLLKSLSQTFLNNNKSTLRVYVSY